MSATRGDRESFEELYRATYPSIFAYCRRRLPMDEAEDTVAQVYAVAWEKSDEFIGAESSIAWLYGVGYRTISTRYRTKRRRQSLNDRLKGERSEVRNATEAEAVVHDEVSRAEQALACLKPAEQELIRLIAYENLTYVETAAATGLSENAVRSKLYRARKNLRIAYNKTTGGAS